MAKKKKKLTIYSRYSGSKSTHFWATVNAIDNDSDRNEMYSLGVALQNMEEYVLKQLSYKRIHAKIKS